MQYVCGGGGLTVMLTGHPVSKINKDNKID
jgi:hypothetical protein